MHASPHYRIARIDQAPGMVHVAPELGEAHMTNGPGVMMRIP